MRIIITFFITSLILFAGSAMGWNGYTHKVLWNESIKDIDFSSCTKSELENI